MKLQFCLMILIFTNLWCYCQEPVVQITDSGNSAINFYHLFDNLDSNKIETKILFDKIIPFADIFNFDGKDSIGIATLDEWREMYFEINKAAINKPILPSLQSTFQEANEMYTQQNIIPIGILNVKFNTLNDSAFEKGLINLQDGKLYDIPGKSESPYYSNRVFSATPLVSNIDLSENKFIISDDFYFSNDTLSIDHFEIDFGDGEGFGNYQKNEVITINYSIPGEKLIEIKTIFKDNSILIANLKVSYVGCSPPTPDLTELLFNNQTCPSMLPYSNWVYTGNVNDKNGAYGYAKVTIWYAFDANNHHNNVLTKPLILLDGFDPDPQTRAWPQLYCLLNQEGTADILRSYCYNYDIIVVDWVGGADWIQKNAFTLVEILKWINANKVGCNKNIVVGPSMGGIIGKYALSYMEKNNIPHDVGIFIPWDSPHRGANIPLGLQYWVNYYASGSPLMQEFVDMLNSPAARQLLVYQNPGAGSLRPQLLSDLNYVGNYPQQPLLIGVANGSGIGHPQNNPDGGCLTPGAKILDMKTQLQFGGVWNDVATAEAYAIPDENDPLTTIFHGIESQQLTETVQISGTHPFDNAPGGYFPHLDEIPNYSTRWIHNKYLGNCFTRTYINLHFPYIDFIPTISALDLDYPTYKLTGSYPNYDLFANPITAAQTPFNYIISTPAIPSNNFEPGYEPTWPHSYNEQHSSITKEKRDFLLNLISNYLPNDLFIQNKILFNPVNPNPVLIQALNSITAGSNVDINQPQGDVIITNGNDVTFHAGNEINLEPGFEANYNFETIIEPFNFTNCNPVCDFPPTIESFNKFPSGTICEGANVELSAGLNNPTECFYDNVTYNWEVKIPNATTYSQLNDHSSSIYYAVNFPGGGDYYFKVQAVNNAGTSNIVSYTLLVWSNQYCGGGGLKELVISDTANIPVIPSNKENIFISILPNPSQGICIVQYLNGILENANLQVYNMLGNVIYKSNLKNQQTQQIDLTGLADGMYYIRVQNQEQSFTQKIIIQR